MKKILVMLLAAVMSVSMLAGCSSKETKDGESGVNSSSAAESSEAAAEAYVPGTKTDTKFTSEWMGLEYNLSSDMVMATDEQIKQATQSGADMLYDDSEAGKDLLDYSDEVLVYEMMAVDTTDNSNLSVMAEKLSLPSMTEDQYLNALKQQIGSMSADITYDKEGAMEVAGKEYTQLSYTMNVSGQTMKQTYLVRKQGDRMIGIVLTYFDEDGLTRLMDGFAPLS